MASNISISVNGNTLQGGDWDVSEPEEQDGSWFVEYSREV